MLASQQYAQIMDSDWAAFVEDNDDNRGQKYPFKERTAFNPGTINLFITIFYYDEGEYDDGDRETRPKFQRGQPRPPAKRQQ